MPQLPKHILRLADLANRKPTRFEVMPDAAGRAAIAKELEIVDLRKLVFRGQIAPMGRSDWVLDADLGVTVVQSCVITLEQVTTRTDEPVRRVYAADLPEIDGTEVEMPEDDTVEPLPTAVDVAAVMIEAISLALPPFPRAADAELGVLQVTEPGVTPMTDEDAKPFAGLGALRDTLENKADGGSSE